MKLHLDAIVPNDGARLLANWVIDRHGGDLVKASSVLIISPIVIQRIVDDQITPGQIIGADLHKHVGIVARDFRQLTQRWWFGDDAAPKATDALAA